VFLHTIATAMLARCLAERIFPAYTLKKRHFLTAKRLLAPAGLALAMLVLAPVQGAQAARRAAPARPDPVADFRALAQQDPWTCRQAADGEAECAWQNRLRKQSWRWSDAGQPSCLSRQARWWNQAQAALPPTTLRSVWDTRWSAQTLRFGIGGEERLLLLERGRDGQWQATEWRWNPNPRPATRRWQEGRWKLLVEAAARRQAEAASAAQPGAARMQPVLRRVLGARPGEFGLEGLRLETAGRLCLQVGDPLPGQSKLPLSYSPNDSRLEQRAAMHLQLSRQHPDAKWLTQFKMLDMPANLPSGAKFLATWVEGGALNSQLWMPAKDDTATLRLRASIRLPRGQNDAAVLWQGRQALERELTAVAVQWAAAYE
jgi:hypothetical protein